MEITQGEYKGNRLCEQVFKKERESNPDYLVIAHVMKEHEVDMALAHPRTILASDGILNNGSGHPELQEVFPDLSENMLSTKKLSVYMML